MTLLDTLNSDLKDALQGGQRERADLIRNLKSDLKYREIEKRESLTEEEMIAVLASAAKKRREAIEQYQAAGRDDLVQREQGQLDLINHYLPQPLSENELLELIDAAIAESGASGAADMGKVMKLIMPKVKGRAEGNVVRQLVQSRLTG
jgi:hypothetical protein